MTEEEMFKILDELAADGEAYADGTPLGVDIDPNLEGSPMTAGKNTFVGYGINLFEGPSFKEAITSPLFDSTVYADKSKRGGNKYIDDVVYNESESETAVSENLNEVYSSHKLAYKAGTAKPVPVLVGKVTDSYNTNKGLTNQAKFYRFVYSKLLYKHTLDPLYLTDTEKMKALIKPKVLDLINNQTSPDNVFRNVGTHIITTCGIGGSVNISALYNSTTTATGKEIEAALDFESAWVTGKLSSAKNNKEKSIRESSTITMNAKGGIESITGGDMEGIAPQLKIWAESIKDGPTLGCIYEILPVWELASNPARRDELKKVFENSAKYKNNELLTYFPKGGTSSDIKPVLENNKKYKILNMQTMCGIVGDKKDNVITTFEEGAVWSGNQTGMVWIAEESLKYPGWFAFKNTSVASGDPAYICYNGNLKYYYFNGDGLRLGRNNGGDNFLFKAVEDGYGFVFLHIKSNEQKVMRAGLHIDEYRIIELVNVNEDSSGFTKWKIEEVTDQ